MGIPTLDNKDGLSTQHISTVYEGPGVRAYIYMGPSVARYVALLQQTIALVQKTIRGCTYILSSAVRATGGGLVAGVAIGGCRVAWRLVGGGGTLCGGEEEGSGRAGAWKGAQGLFGVNGR